MDVSEEDVGQVRFEFYNDSEVESCMARIYFDDAGGLLSGPEIVNGPGTFFNLEGSPPLLPAGDDLSPIFPKPPDFMASAEEPVPTNGVNPTSAPDPDEWVAIIFDLVGGNSVDNVVAGLEDDSLRIGVHVISFPDGSSEAAVTAPEPATLGLILLGGLMLLRRRRSHSTPS